MWKGWSEHQTLGGSGRVSGRDESPSVAAVGWKGKGKGTSGCSWAKGLLSNLMPWGGGEGLNSTGLTQIPQDKNKPEAKNELT